MPSCRTVIVATLFAATVAGTAATPRSQVLPRADQTYTSATTAILVDVVVRDRRGQPVTDLAAEDFELFEDGAPQRVDTFSRVSRGGGIGVGVAWRSATNATTVMTSKPADTPNPSAEDSVEGTVALIFDHLSPESLRLAQRATLTYIPAAGESRVRVGVFATDPGLQVLQRYTHDRTVVRGAISRVLPASTTDGEKAERAEELRTRRRDLGTENAAVASAASLSGAAMARGGGDIGGRESELRLVQTELNMLRSFQHMERDHRGYNIASALLGVVDTLTALPGRKTIVFFSEGFPVSPALSAQLDSVIEAANRANVTAYAIDANGLRTNAASTTLKREMDGFVEDRFRQLATGSERTTQPLTMAFERVEDTLRLDTRTGLARLAEDTGGFLVEQSSDLSSAFKRIDEDNQFHYLLTYSPRNTTFDGKFRTIRVKVRRPSLQVFARRGYRAVRNAGAGEADGVEAAAVSIFDHNPLPNAFPVHARAFNFPDPSRPGLTPLLVHLRTNALQFDLDPAKGTYSSRAAIVVRVKDAAGQPTQRLSQQYLLSGDARDVEAARQGDIIFYREVDLDPGIYTVESLVFDAAAQRGSVRVTTLSVPAAGGRDAAMSSLVLVNRIEETADAPAVGMTSRPPLYVDRTLLYPNLGESISKAEVKELPFYFALYGSDGTRRLTAQLLHNGRMLAEAPVTLPASSDARVQHVGRLPVANLPAGTYELRIVLKDAKRELSRTAFFTLVE
jgi:VWFA-related protein